MINFDDYVNENKTEHNKNWLRICKNKFIIKFNRKLARH